MFVSILQLMGFPLAKPVNSRASELAQDQPDKAADPVANTKQVPASQGRAPVNSARRQEVKAQPVKAKAAAKVSSALGKTKAGAKALAKPVAKPKAKTPAKPAPVVKTGAKSVAKAVPQSALKATAVAPAKLPAKPKASVAVKASQPASKPAAKAQAPAAPVKALKPSAKVQPKDPVKTTTAKAAKTELVPAKTKGVSAPPVQVARPVAQLKPALAAPAPLASASVPARAGRPSSRLAQLTVPSMAQSVASTAAKASFIQTMSSPLIVPPLASAIKKDPKLANNWKSKPVEQLIDAELIAMPDDEYMNNTQMAYFRHKLNALKKEILIKAGETTEHLREDTVVVPDPADRATIEEEHALELRTRDRERKLLKKIEQSIVRIDAGDYGYCDETGEPIGVGRLLARPTANLSLEAQQRRELKQKMFGD